jgi:hypothetical protein
MGKKKSKVAKQKQTKAKQRNSLKKNVGKTSLGGVAITKGFSSKSQQSRQQTQQQTSVILHVQNGNSSNSKKTMNNNTVGINRKELLQKLSQTRDTPKVFSSPSSIRLSTSDVALQPRLESIQEDSEQQDFDRQMASMHERQWVAQHTQSSKKRGKKSNSSRDAVAVIVSQMKPASFVVEKTADDLLHETMHKMVHMTGVGISAVEKTPVRSNKTVEPTFQNSLPVMSSIVSNATTSSSVRLHNTSSLAVALQKHQHEQTQFIEQNTSANPFAVLKNDDSDEEDGGKTLTSNDWSLKIQPPQFQFAPQSFSLMPRETPTPASTPIPNHRIRQNENVPAVQSCSFPAAATISNGGGVFDPDDDPDL